VEGNQYFTHINRVPLSTCEGHLLEETKRKKGKRETGNRLTDIRRTIQTHNTRQTARHICGRITGCQRTENQNTNGWGMDKYVYTCIRRRNFGGQEANNPNFFLPKYTFFGYCVEEG
jgi:hypothetical protein